MFLQKPSHVEYKMDRAAHNPAHDTKKHACCSVTDYVNQSAGQQKFADLKIPLPDARNPVLCCSVAASLRTPALHKKKSRAVIARTYSGSVRK